MKKKLFFSAITAIFCTTLFSFIEKEDPLRKMYAETITAADLKKHLSVIASDEYEGRETGKKGQHMTAEYIANQFISFGIPGIHQLRPPWIETYGDVVEHHSINPAEAYYQDVPLILYTPGNGTVSDNHQSAASACH